MPSQPDYTHAHKLSPHLKPEDPAEALQKQNRILAERLAAAEDKTVEEIMKEIEQDALPAEQTPHQVPVPPQEQTVAGTKREEAQFFANKEGTKYYPIDKRDTGPFAKMAEEKALYFKTKEEAEVASFVAA